MKVLLGVIVSISLILGGLYYYRVQQAAEFARVRAEQKAQIEQQARDELNKQFEAALNELLKNVNERATVYKTRRQVITSLADPKSLADPAYVEENYRLMETSIPQLHKLMDEVMALFPRTEKEIGSLARNAPEEKRNAIMASWKKLEETQASTYVAFFASEQEILKAYLNLMKFYSEKRGQYAVDPQSGAVLFKEPADSAREMELRQAIMDLAQQQALVLGGPLPEENPEQKPD